MSILESLTALFAPDDCLVCGREGSLLCASCFTQLPSLPGRCFGCHQQIVNGVACGTCLSLSGCISMSAAASYDGSAKQLVGWLKFRGNQSAARIMAACMASGPVDLPPSALLVHVPATTEHIRQRGFDQAELITRELSRLLRLPRASLLRRTGHKHQLGADRQTRLAQLQDTVTVRRPDRCRGVAVVLVDDVLTTGSSIHAATEVLLAAGATRVDAVAFAQADPSSPRSAILFSK